MTGVDPTGWGGVVAGFGDQRGVELLVAAGFTPEEAIRIASLNGATFLGNADRIGTIATGKDADIMIVRGNPAATIGQIRNVTVVFKEGVGYDSAKLIESVRGLIGE
jgi:imidazolonepropionase-like amidohydrolase